MDSKPRYEILDGLRGVAALIVVIFHCFEIYCPPGGQQMVNHGYLAVDFFFVLSGFVIGYAYDDRWGKMTAREFFKRRLIRLHPMVIAGAVIGLCLFFLGGNYYPGITENPLWKIILCFVMCILMIPCGPGIDIRGWGDFYPLNCPSWTLAYEYIANILYAFVFRHLPKAALAVLCICCAFFTLDLTLGWDVFGLFPFTEMTGTDGQSVMLGGPRYKVEGGWYLTSQELYIGFSRLLYPFLCGLLISRIIRERSSEANPGGSPLRVRNGFPIAALILAAILCMPCIGGKDGIANGIYQAAAILFIFPILVLIGAGSTTRTKAGTKICIWLGELSYPLYITHYPLLYLHLSFAIDHPDAPTWIHFAEATGVIIMSVILARLLFKAYDTPVRKWLTENWKTKREKSA